MKQNDSGHPPLDTFDNSFPESAIQTCETEHYTATDPSSTSCNLLLEHNHFSNANTLRGQRLKLVVKNASTPTNDHPDTAVIGTANFVYSLEDPVALIGGVFVQHPFQNQGIGTRLKQQINNHIKQQQTERAFTWLATLEGISLAKRTGYKPTTDYFPNYPNIWIKHF